MITQHFINNEISVYTFKSDIKRWESARRVLSFKTDFGIFVHFKCLKLALKVTKNTTRYKL